eukprot:3609080-Amphidinium_carterae.1
MEGIDNANDSRVEDGTIYAHVLRSFNTRYHKRSKLQLHTSLELVSKLILTARPPRSQLESNSDSATALNSAI